MKALEIQLQNPNKLACIFDLGVYCFINAQPVVDGALQEDMQALLDSDYLYKPNNSNPVFETIIETSYWETTYVGCRVDSLDTLIALMIQGVDFSIMFFDADKDNVMYWQDALKHAVIENNQEQVLFDLNRLKIGEQNQFQVWCKDAISDEECSQHLYIITGTEEILQKIEQKFNEPAQEIGEYHLFSYDENIRWIELS